MRHYYISVTNKYGADCTILVGTHLPSMAEAYACLRNLTAAKYRIKLDIDENYDPDLGSFSFGQATGDNNPEIESVLAKFKSVSGME